MSPAARLLAGKSLLVFDLDGTLIDSSPVHARAFSETFAPLGIDVDYASIAGMKTEDAVARLLGEAGQGATSDRIAELTSEKRRRALASIGDAVPLAGAAEFVECARKHYRIALCSSGSRPAVLQSLEVLSLQSAFDPIVSGDDVAKGKPDSAPYREVLRRAEVNPDQALAFEDAPLGEQSARAAGIAVQLVTAVSDGNGAALDWAELRAALDELHA